MSLLSYEIEHFNPYSPRAHLTANVPCQLGDQPQVVLMQNVDSFRKAHPIEPKDRERAVRNSRTTTSHFLRRLSLRLHLIHHGEVKAETIRGMRFGNSPDTPLPIKQEA